MMPGQRMPTSQEQAVGNSMPPYSGAPMHTVAGASMQQRPPPSSSWPVGAEAPQGVSGTSQQQMGMPSYGNMPGWGGGGQSNPYGMQQQNPMSLSDDQRKMLRMRQEQLIMQQRKASQQQQQGGQHPGTMYLPPPAPSMMGGNYPQPSSMSPGPAGGPLT